MRRAARRSMVALLYSEKSTPVRLRNTARIFSKVPSSFADVAGLALADRYGCRLRRTSSRASVAMGMPVSTTPARIALRGMSPNLAVCGDCAKVIPPPALIARRPSVPSDPLPESTTPMACGPRCVARVSKRKSMER